MIGVIGFLGIVVVFIFLGSIDCEPIINKILLEMAKLTPGIAIGIVGLAISLKIHQAESTMRKILFYFTIILIMLATPALLLSFIAGWADLKKYIIVVYTVILVLILIILSGAFAHIEKEKVKQTRTVGFLKNKNQ